MRRFPYFLPEGVLLLLAAVALFIPLIAPQLFNYAMAVLSLALFGGVFLTFDRYARNFDSAAARIKGLSWDSHFFSLGTLELSFKGEKARYRSEIGKGGKTVPVDYYLMMENGNDASFMITKDGSGGFSANGGEGFLKAARGEIEAFDRCYPVRSISNIDGALEICVRLEFERGAPPSKEEKMADMSGFLEDFLSFTYLLNSALRKKKA